MKYITRNQNNVVNLKLNTTPENTFSGTYIFNFTSIQSEAVVLLTQTDVSVIKNRYQQFQITSGDTNNLEAGQHDVKIYDIDDSSTIIYQDRWNVIDADIDDNTYFFSSGGTATFFDVTGYTNASPSAPVAFNATLLSTGLDVKLSWLQGSTNTHSFDLWRKKGSDAYINIGQELLTLTYNDNNLSYDTDYIYKVRAYNDIGYSDFSAEKTIRTKISGSTTGTTPSYIYWTGDTLNGVGTFVNERQIRSNSGMTFSDATLSLQGDINATGSVIIGEDLTIGDDLIVSGDTEIAGGLNVSNNTGLGTSTPQAKLHISGGTGSLATGLAFNDGDTGIYETADDVLSFNTAGSNVMNISTGGIYEDSFNNFHIRRLTRSATTPNYSWNGDGDTGLGSAGADQLSLIAGGVEGIRVTTTTTTINGDLTSTGATTLLGGGTTFISPYASYEGQTPSTVQLYKGETGNNTNFASFNFVAAPTLANRLIGTFTFVNAAVVSNEKRIAQVSASTQDEVNSGKLQLITYNAGAANVTTIDKLGNLGLGITPAYPLDIYRNLNGVARFRFQNPHTGAAAQVGFELTNAAGQMSTILYSGAHSIVGLRNYAMLYNNINVGGITFMASGINGKLRFGTDTVNYSPNALVVSNNNIGIGINEPIYKLDVSGDTRIDGGLNVVGDAIIDASLRVGDDNNNVYLDASGLTLVGNARVVNHILMPADTFKLIGIKPADINIEGIFITLDFIYTSQKDAFSKGFVPNNWDNTTDVEVAIDWMTDVESTGSSVVWGIEYKGIRNGDVIDGNTTTFTQAFTGNGAGKLKQDHFTTKLLHTQLHNEDVLGIRIFRDTDSEFDTLDETARFLKIHLHYVVNKLGDSYTE